MCNPEKIQVANGDLERPWEAYILTKSKKGVVASEILWLIGNKF